MVFGGWKALCLVKQRSGAGFWNLTLSIKSEGYTSYVVRAQSLFCRNFSGYWQREKFPLDGFLQHTIKLERSGLGTIRVYSGYAKAQNRSVWRRMHLSSSPDKVSLHLFGSAIHHHLERCLPTIEYVGFCYPFTGGYKLLGGSLAGNSHQKREESIGQCSIKLNS